ncbi:hypothetical protein VHEMI04480 [[Torrubiella] hemipterigena]|uniref:DUF2423 domain-containing protein n=1 Tax=[Torrubiella] hemipterigena TaxID=1531966 RepID=A0A0A1T1E9_9HYPO|nr:hypothetical protein VHEMI04480 [[Torrubiella] hemipterigena]
MAKSSRSSTKKANNRRLASAVFTPAEEARAERLSAKLLELAKAPKPEPVSSTLEDGADEDKLEETAMEVDAPRPARKRIDKRKQKRSSIVFQKYSDRLKAKKKQVVKAKAAKA